VLDGDRVDNEGPSHSPPPSDRRFEITFPSRAGDVDQDEEWCTVRLNGDVRRLRFHDYHEVYSIPGLYEQLFYDELECRSPETVCGLLRAELAKAGGNPSDLRVFDVGAGNGMVGEELKQMGAGRLVGVDIIEEAAAATHRDRPGLYDDYFVLDLTDIPADTRAELEAQRFNCLTSVAALGFGDIPPRAFAEAYNLVSDGGWLAFTIKEDFLGEEDKTGFSQLIDMILEEGNLELCGDRRYQHRLSVAREPLHYVAMAARKRSDVPLDWTDDLND
jgi:predicted TPR repeat methyltransferase